MYEKKILLIDDDPKWSQSELKKIVNLDEVKKRKFSKKIYVLENINFIPRAYNLDERDTKDTTIKHKQDNTFEIIKIESGKEAFKIIKEADVILVDYILNKEGNSCDVDDEYFSADEIDEEIDEMNGYHVLKFVYEINPKVATIIYSNRINNEDGAGILSIDKINYATDNYGLIDFASKRNEDVDSPDTVLYYRMLTALDRVSFRNVNEGFKKASSLDLNKEQEIIQETVFVGNSQFIDDIKGELDTLALQNRKWPILINGDSGSGKQLVARSIHDRNVKMEENQIENNFVSVNCGAMTFDLFEIQLFGASHGAYTDSIGPKIGPFLKASGYWVNKDDKKLPSGYVKKGAKPDRPETWTVEAPLDLEEKIQGTIFLDEIGEIPFEKQAALLTVLEKPIGENFYKIIMVGDSVPKKININMIYATNRELKLGARNMINAQNNTPHNPYMFLFRTDLYFRLVINMVIIPPLKDDNRKGDIFPLIEHFLIKKIDESSFSKLYKKKFNNLGDIFSKEALNRLLEHKWVGNVREIFAFCNMIVNRNPKLDNFVFEDVNKILNILDINYIEPEV